MLSSLYGTACVAVTLVFVPAMQKVGAILLLPIYFKEALDKKNNAWFD